MAARAGPVKDCGPASRYAAAMRSLSENNFHLVMGTLLLLSTFIDPAMRAVLPAWKPPEVGFVTLVLGLVWVALFAGYRGRNLEDRVRVLEDRLDRTERKVADLETDQSERARPLYDPK